MQPPVDGGDALLQPLNMTPVNTPAPAPAPQPKPDAAARSLIEEAARRILTKEAKALLADVDGHVTYCRKSYEACEGADALVLVTEWNEFREPDFDRIKKLLRRPVVFDGRNIYNPQMLRELGFAYFGVGRG